jgi:hypothetical protein
MATGRAYKVLSNVSNCKLIAFRFDSDGYDVASTGIYPERNSVTVTSAGDGYYTCTFADDFPSGSVVYANAALIQAATNSNDAAYVTSVVYGTSGTLTVGVVTQSAAGTAAKLTSPDAWVSVLLVVRDR